MKRIWGSLVLRALVESLQTGIVLWAVLATLSALGVRICFAQ